MSFYFYKNSDIFMANLSIKRFTLKKKKKNDRAYINVIIHNVISQFPIVHFLIWRTCSHSVAGHNFK